MGSLGWPAWLLISLLALAVLVASALRALRLHYRLAYAFPASVEARVEIAFLGWRWVLAHREASGPGPVEGGNTEVSSAGGPGRDAGPQGAEPEAGGGAPSGAPRPGQGGFLAMPSRYAWLRKRVRLRAAARKWIVDLPVWRCLASYVLASGWRTLRFIGPSMEHLHVGSADVLNLGRFAALWSSLGATLPFLRCPVEYGFNERPFALRLRLSGGCHALGLIAFLLALLVSLPWRRLSARFLSCWRNPRLAPWQRRLLASA